MDEEQRPYRILCLNTTAGPASPAIFQACREELELATGRPVELLVENMFVKKFTEEGLGTFGEMSRKYVDEPPIDVILMAKETVRLPELVEAFPDVPVISPTPTRLQGAPSEYSKELYFWFFRFSPAKTARVAFECLPQTSKLIVITGSCYLGRLSEKTAREEMGEQFENVAVEYWSGIPLPEMESRIAALPKDHAVLFLDMVLDRDGGSYHEKDLVRRLSRASSAPLFGAHEWLLESGIVGGYVESPERLGHQVGDLLVRLARGDELEPVNIFDDYGEFQFDWREMHRWGIRESRLPKEAHILNRPDSFFGRHPEVIRGLTALCTLLILVVFGLLAYLHQRHKADRAIRESEKKYRLLFENNVVGIGISDPSGNVLALNDAMSRQTGYSLEQFSKANLRDTYVNPDDRTRLHAALQRDGKVENIEVQLKNRSGESYWASITSTPIQYGGQEALLTTALDITEHKRGQEVREELITKLETQNAELERFTYTVSHDLRSPLITIEGYAGALSEDLTEGNAEAMRDDIARISGAAQKMGRLLNELLDLSRVGRVVKASEGVPLKELIDEALGMTRREIESNNIQVEVAPNLPMLFGDRTRLSEVFQNLIDNAMKYMGDQPRPRVEIGARTGGDFATCYVRDNGIGIASRYHERIFGLFDQLDASADGSGVGLALAKRIIEVHGGRIWVESAGPGHGATFWVTIPLQSGSESFGQGPEAGIPDRSASVGH